MQQTQSVNEEAEKENKEKAQEQQGDDGFGDSQEQKRQGHQHDVGVHTNEAKRNLLPLQSPRLSQDKILVLTRAGKPVYSSSGDELEMSSAFGLLQAMMAKTEEKLKVVRAGRGFVMVFSVCGPLLVAAISKTDVPVGFLQVQLEYVFAQILVHFTLSALHNTFSRMQGYDLRSMLGGTRRELHGIIDMAYTSPSMLLSAVQHLTLPAETRNFVTSVLLSSRQANLLYAIIVADNKLVAHVAPKRHPLKASDLLLLMNFVNTTSQLRSQETWTPFCLPAFNSTGFLHAYAAYLSKHVCLLLLSSGESLEQFHFSSQQKDSIILKLGKADLLNFIDTAVEKGNLAPESCEAASSIQVIYRTLKFDQYVQTSIATHAPLHKTGTSRLRLIQRYIAISEKLHSYSRRVDFVTAPLDKKPEQDILEGGITVGPTRYSQGCEQSQIWDVQESEAILAVLHPGQYELYASFHIFTSSSQAMACANRFAAWIRSNRNSLFVTKPVYW